MRKNIATISIIVCGLLTLLVMFNHHNMSFEEQLKFERIAKVCAVIAFVFKLK